MGIEVADSGDNPDVAESGRIYGTYGQSENWLEVASIVVSIAVVC